MNVEEVAAWLKGTVAAMVDEPEDVDVSIVEGRASIVFEVVVAPVDVRRVIGRQGKSADSLRVLLLAMTGKLRTMKKVTMEIVEPVAIR